jgi:hypothetical protein
MKSGFIVKGGADGENKKGVKEDLNDMQMQKLVLINFSDS